MKEADREKISKMVGEVHQHMDRIALERELEQASIKLVEQQKEIDRLKEKIKGQRKSMKAFMEDAEKFRIENIRLKHRVDLAEWLVEKYRDETND